MRKLIDDGRTRSATFRGLIERLDRERIIVYVRFAPCANRVAACTLFAAPERDTRRLLIRLDRFGRSAADLIGLLAHELQHAVEVAEATAVIDEASFRQFYATTGVRSGNGYETAEAMSISRVVAAELARPRR